MPVCTRGRPMPSLPSLRPVFDQILATRDWRFAAHFAPVSVAASEAVDAWRDMESSLNFLATGVDGAGLAPVVRCRRCVELILDYSERRVRIPDSDLCQILQTCTAIERLTLPAPSALVLKTVATHLSGLKHLCVVTLETNTPRSRDPPLSVPGVTSVIAKCTALESLDLRTYYEDCSEYKDVDSGIDRVLSALGRARLNLKELHVPLSPLSGSNLRCAFKSCTNLLALTVYTLPLVAAFALGSCCCPQLRLLHMHALCGEQLQSSTPAAMEAIVGGCRLLEDFALCNHHGQAGESPPMSSPQVVRPLQGATRLQKVSLEGVVEDAVDSLLEVFKLCEQLVEVKLIDCAEDGLLNGLVTARPALQALRLSSSMATDAEMIAIAEHCTSLRTLEIMDIMVAAGGHLSPAGVIACAHHCASLEVLHIHRAVDSTFTSKNALDDDALLAISHGCPLLTDVDFSPCGITDTGLESFFSACGTRLEWLRLCSSEYAMGDSVESSDDVDISSKTYVHIVRSCPVLTRLELPGTNVTGDALCALAESPASQLTQLDLDGCEHLTVQGIRALAKLPCLQVLRCHTSLMDPPGARYRYANTSHDLLGDTLKWLVEHAQNRALYIPTIHC